MLQEHNTGEYPEIKYLPNDSPGIRQQSSECLCSSPLILKYIQYKNSNKWQKENKTSILPTEIRKVFLDSNPKKKALKLIQKLKDSIKKNWKFHILLI